jgi:hypothetical protein
MQQLTEKPIAAAMKNMPTTSRRLVNMSSLNSQNRHALTIRPMLNTGTILRWKKPQLPRQRALICMVIDLWNQLSFLTYRIAPEPRSSGQLQ